MTSLEVDPHILFIIGNELRFVEPVQDFRRYVGDEVGIPEDRMRVIFGAYRENDDILGEVRGAFLRAECDGAPVVIVYNGHGLQASMHPNGSPLYYSSVARMVVPEVPFIFINSCCHAAGAIHYLAQQSPLDETLRVIALASVDELGYNCDLFLEDIIDSFRNCEYYMKERVVRRVEGGTELFVHEYLDGTDSVIHRVPGEEVQMEDGDYTLFSPVVAGVSLDHILFPTVK